MNCKRIICAVFAVSLILLLGFISKFYIYPVTVSTKKHYLDNDRVLNNLTKNLTLNKELIFWDTPIYFGMAQSDVIIKSPKNYIIYDDAKIDVDIIYEYLYRCSGTQAKGTLDYDNRLDVIYLRIPYNVSIEQKLISYYGKKSIFCYRGSICFYIWLLDNGYVAVESRTDSHNNGYIYVKIGRGGYKWKENVKFGAYRNDFDSKSFEVVSRKDDVDIIIENRAKQKFDNSIFAGLRFGDSPEQVRRALNNVSHIPLSNLNKDSVNAICIRDYQAKYLNEGLVELTLFAEEDECYKDIGKYYSTIYGVTKGNVWRYSNCKIVVTLGMRKEYNPIKDAGYNSGAHKTLYHASFGDDTSKFLTEDEFFVKIIYKYMTTE